MDVLIGHGLFCCMLKLTTGLDQVKLNNLGLWLGVQGRFSQQEMLSYWILSPRVRKKQWSVEILCNMYTGGSIDY